MAVQLDPQLMEILACPSDDHAPLRAGTPADPDADVLTCTACGRGFPIVDRLAAAVAAHGASALATHAGVVAHAGEVIDGAGATALVRALDRGASGADIFRDPFADPDETAAAPPVRLV